MTDGANGRQEFAIGGILPERVARPASCDDLADAVAETAATGGALVALGFGAHRGLGHPPTRYDVALSTAGLARVVDYTPADMTVTAESGVTVATLQSLLATEGQWLPLDPPLPEATTVGGLVAADLGGLTRASQGRVRDYVIGVRAVTSEGRAVRAGGKVVKNVAGYDLMKLLTGSLGTLAIVSEATLKVRPRPARIHCFALACGPKAAARTLAERVSVEAGVTVLSATLVLAVGEAVAPPMLVYVLGGIEEDVAAVRARILSRAAEVGAEIVLEADGDTPESQALVTPLRDFLRREPGNLVLRAATLPRRAGDLADAFVGSFPSLRFAGAAGRCLVDARAGIVTLALDVADPLGALEAIAALAAAHGAQLVVERWPDALAASIAVWSPLPRAFPLMRRMKHALDPRGTLAPGRFVGRL